MVLVDNTSEIALRRIWPVFGLRLEAPRLRLAVLADDDLPELHELSRGGIHDPREMPFPNGWTERPEEEAASGFARYFWQQRARWTPDSWALPFVVRRDGEAVGVQQLTADHFPVLRVAGTGSWVARHRQREGIGTEMRAAVLALAFDHLGSAEAVSSAFAFNHGSIRVSEKLGYARNGVRTQLVRGVPQLEVLFRLTREDWTAVSRPPVRVEGFDECRVLFGLGAPEPGRAPVLPGAA